MADSKRLLKLDDIPHINVNDSVKVTYDDKDYMYSVKNTYGHPKYDLISKVDLKRFDPDITFIETMNLKFTDNGFEWKMEGIPEDEHSINIQNTQMPTELLVNIFKEVV